MAFPAERQVVDAMGLDALVYCDCYERGAARSAPPTAVAMDATGEVIPSTQDAREVAAFDRWRRDACEHPGGVRVREYLGNVAAIAALRQALVRRSGDFPILVEKVLYSGSHTGDVLDVGQFDGVDAELHRLGEVADGDSEARELIVQFRERFGLVVSAARAVGKPIAF